MKDWNDSVRDNAEQIQAWSALCEQYRRSLY